MPQLPAVFEQSIPLPGNRSLPVWALGLGALIAVGGALLLKGKGSLSGAGNGPTANVAGLQTNQFFTALSQQATNLQNLLTQQRAQTAAQFATQGAAFESFRTTTQSRLDSLSAQMQTGLTNVSAQVQQTNLNLSHLQQQVDAFTKREGRVEEKQAEVFSRAWSEMGGPVTAVQTAEHFPNPQQYGVGSTGIWITDSQGRVRWQDTSKFGTLIQ